MVSAHGAGRVSGTVVAGNSTGGKWIDEIDEAMLEVGKISSRDGKFVDPRNGRDLPVEITQGTPNSFAIGFDLAKNPRCHLIETQHPGRKRLRDETLESIFKQPAASALGHRLQAETDLRDRYRRDIQRCWFLRIEPFQHSRRGR